MARQELIDQRLRAGRENIAAFDRLVAARQAAGLPARSRAVLREYGPENPVAVY